MGEHQTIRAQLETLRLQPGYDQPDEHLRRATQLYERTVKLSDEALLVDAELVLAQAHDRKGDLQSAKRMVLSAFRRGERISAHAGAARAASIYLRFVPPGSDEWRRWVRVAELHLQLAGGVRLAEFHLLGEFAYEAMEDERFGESLMYAQRHTALALEEFGPGHPAVGVAHMDLAEAMEMVGEVEQAEDARRQALEIFLAAEPFDPELVAAGYLSLGHLLYHQKELSQAVDSFERALALVQDLPSDDRWARETHGEAVWTLGLIMYEFGQYERALGYVASAKRLLPKDDPYCALSAYQLEADVLVAMGRLPEAVATLEIGLSFIDADEPEWEDRVEARAQLERLRRGSLVASR